MMDHLPFLKMTGAGNDFVVIDNRLEKFSLSAAQIETLCHRRFGIGADGLLAVEAVTDTAQADFRMRYFNSDGGEAEMCGNGARCFARFVQAMPRAQADLVRFLTPAGLITGRYLDDEIEINMTAPTESQLQQRADFGWGEISYHFINTGVPHAVVFVEDVATIPILVWGRAIRQSPIFPRGTNVNFVQISDEKNLIVRTYERGVEDETLACGTGVVAAALLTALVHSTPLPLRVQVRSGAGLMVNATLSDVDENKTGRFAQVTLTGPAVTVFSGDIKL